MHTTRKIVKIDEEKCNGCGLCVPACAEGAIEIVDGKARLASDVYCDGLGACLGECPQDAITIVEREADPFDEEAVEEHLSKRKTPANTKTLHHGASPQFAGCPGTLAKILKAAKTAAPENANSGETPSSLTNWPIQIKLVPEEAPYFKGAELLIAADCVPFSVADFHRDILAGKTLLIGCPKLDDPDFYRGKLARIFARNDIKSIDVIHMEVPCCFGLVRIVEQALSDVKKEIPCRLIKVGLGGQILQRSELKKETVSTR